MSFFYDGKKIPFSDNFFDGILCTEVLEHVLDLEIVLREFHRVLKPEGILLISIPFV